MTETQSSSTDTRKIHEATREAVEKETNVREEVYRVTLQALKEGKLDPENIKRVIQAVAEGARAGASNQGERVGETVGEAMSGLEAALVKAAEASKLAIEEAAGRAEEFSQKELRRSLEDLKALEELYVDTLGQIARSSKDRVAEIFDDLASHARNSGTAIGTYVTDVMADLTHQLSEAGRAGFEASAQAARATGATVVQIASGILAGIADALQPKEPKDSD